MSKVLTHCVAIPFYNRVRQVEALVTKLVEQSVPSTRILLLDDGSKEKIDLNLFKDTQIFLERHKTNLGIGAARNSIVNWCREREIEVIIMIDSDCDPEPDFISQHLKLHSENMDASCIGGGIVGVGKGFWAKLDSIMSWVHSIPVGEVKKVKDPYLLPGTNISFKVSHLPKKENIFNDRLVTGEDALLIRELRNDGKKIMFSPSPVVYHKDRERFQDVVYHSYLWGGHLYLIQFGNNFSSRCLSLTYRIPFFIFFVFATPFFVLLGAIFTVIPWVKQKFYYIFYFPLLLFLWIVKAVAVLKVSANPHEHLLY